MINNKERIEIEKELEIFVDKLLKIHDIGNMKEKITLNLYMIIHDFMIKY